jgi:hypothetical protein
MKARRGFAILRLTIRRLSSYALLTPCCGIPLVRDSAGLKEWRDMRGKLTKRSVDAQPPEVQIASSPPSTPVSLKNAEDAASVFDSEFKAKGIANAADNDTMLRHTYVILTGLAFRESSGHYCGNCSRSVWRVTGATN